MKDDFLVLNIHNIGSTSENRNPELIGTNANVFSLDISGEEIFLSTEEIINIESADYFQCG